MDKKVVSKSKRYGNLSASNGQSYDATRPREHGETTIDLENRVHVIGSGIICDTESRGHATPEGRSPFEIVLDSSQGFIPLWDVGTTLRWRFREQSMAYFEDVAAAKTYIRALFSEALIAWGSAAPVTFKYDEDLWDFEFVMQSGNQCNPMGCVLAAAFFPDAGRHQLKLYPKMFGQSRKEQVDTMIHEIGHVFGLRHFFANISETEWPSEIFGRHERFSIMNYGADSELTEDDKDDLTLLYQAVWSGELEFVNGTPIKLVRPFSSLAFTENALVSSVHVPAAVRPRAASAQPRARQLCRRPIPTRSAAAYLDEQ